MAVRTPLLDRRPPAERLRQLIEHAAAGGVDLSQQVLQLTYGDSAKLRRDPSIPDGDIRFDNGQMFFVGVRVVEGAPLSTLADLNGVVTAAALTDEPAAKGAKKGAKDAVKSRAAKPKAASARP